MYVYTYTEMYRCIVFMYPLESPYKQAGSLPDGHSQSPVYVYNLPGPTRAYIYAHVYIYIYVDMYVFVYP